MKLLDRLRARWWTLPRCAVVLLLCVYVQWLWKNDPRTRWLMQTPLVEFSGRFSHWNRNVESGTRWLFGSTTTTRAGLSEPSAHAPKAWHPAAAAGARPTAPAVPLVRANRPARHVESADDETRAVAAARQPPTPLLSPAEVGVQFDAGIRRFHDGHYAQAALAWQVVTEHHSDDSAAWYFLALSRRGLGQTSEADEALRKAVQAEQSQPCPNLAQLLERVQGPQRHWLEAARRAAGVGPYRSAKR